MALYGKLEYWEERYIHSGDAGVYDWYQTYENLRHLLTPEILKRPFNGITRLQDFDRPTNASQVLETISNEFPSRDNCRVLILGCGNSTFGEDMREDGWTGDIVNVDFSSVVINQMIRKQENKYGAEDAHSRMEFVCADITHGLPFADASFDLIICKGTFDAILCSNGSVSSIKRLVAECDRVLAPAHGCLFVVTHGTPDNRVVFLEHANDPTYYWEGICIDTVAKRDQTSSQKNYVYICRKKSIFGIREEEAVSPVAKRVGEENTELTGDENGNKSALVRYSCE